MSKRKKNTSPAENNQGTLTSAPFDECDSIVSGPWLNLSDPDDRDEINESIAVCRRKIDEAVGELANKVNDIDFAIWILKDHAKALKAPHEPKRKKIKKRHAKLVVEHDEEVKHGGPARKIQNRIAEEKLAKKYGLKTVGSLRSTVSKAKHDLELQNPAYIFRKFLEQEQKTKTRA